MRNGARTVVVTGASAGVGLATAIEFAKAGNRVAVIARESSRLAKATEAIDDAGGKGLAIAADVADGQAVEQAAATIEDEFGPIDVWVNNAMATVFSRFVDVTPEEFDRVTQVTYLGSVHGTLAALKRMQQRDRGTIVQVGSALAYRSIPLQSAYCGAKHAVVGFIDSIRSELLHDRSNVQITVVHLPAVNTPQFVWSRSHLSAHPQPVPPIYQPEVAARAIVWAADHPRREYLVGKSTSMAVLGAKIAPGVGDEFLASEGFSSQMSDLPYDPNRPDNLFSSVDLDIGAHGPFDNKAQPASSQERLIRRLKVAPNLIEFAYGAATGLQKLPQIVRSMRWL